MVYVAMAVQEVVPTTVLAVVEEDAMVVALIAAKIHVKGLVIVAVEGDVIVVAEGDILVAVGL